jgi:hypothetical protein
MSSTDPKEIPLTRLRRLMSEDVSLERAWSELNDARNRPPKATIDAIMFAVRERGLAALKEPATAQRLDCDVAAKCEIERRIANLRIRKD